MFQIRKKSLRKLNLHLQTKDHFPPYPTRKSKWTVSLSLQLQKHRIIIPEDQLPQLINLTLDQKRNNNLNHCQNLLNEKLDKEKSLPKEEEDLKILLIILKLEKTIRVMKKRKSQMLALEEIITIRLQKSERQVWIIKIWTHQQSAQTKNSPLQNLTHDHFPNQFSLSRNRNHPKEISLKMKLLRSVKTNLIT